MSNSTIDPRIIPLVRSLKDQSIKPPKNTIQDISSEKTSENSAKLKENKKVEEDVPEHMAEFFKGIMPDFVLIIYKMFNPICPYCGSKLHRHEIKNWEINKKTNVYK